MNPESLSAVVLPWSPPPQRMERVKRYAGGETTEDDFQRMLDANPDDHQTRLVFADWLDERGDPRAEGYRAIGQLRRRTHQSQYYSIRGENVWLWGSTKLPSKMYTDLYPGIVLPSDWLETIQGTHPTYEHNDYWRYHSTRREAEDAAAVAFGQLSPARKRQILRRKPERMARVADKPHHKLTTAERQRAKKVDLVVLPSDVKGTNCGNCEHIDSKSYCRHPEVRMSVQKNWCCAEWETKDTKRVAKLSRYASRRRCFAGIKSGED
jgi:uncharacterized protein (TIGR02996 family)